MTKAAPNVKGKPSSSKRVLQKASGTKDPIKNQLRRNLGEQQQLKKLLKILQLDQEKVEEQISDPSWGKKKKTGSSIKRGSGKAALPNVKTILTLAQRELL